MKTRLIHIIILSLAALMLGSCADHRNDNMEEFQTMVYFRNGGEQSLTLYRTGEDGFYRVPVCKSGRNLKGVANAVVMPFDEAQMAMYNTKYETSYSLIPQNDYVFTDENRAPLSEQSKVVLEFTEKDAYKLVYISLKTVAISALMTANPDKEYVLPLQVFADANVSDDINLIVLKPGVEIPTVSLVTVGEEPHKYTSASPAKETYTNTVSLNMDENLWDFDCTLEIGDAAWLADYNYNNAKAYTLMPDGTCKLSTNKVHFAKGSLDAPFSIEVNRTGMEMLTEYALPIVLKSCSKSEFVIEEDKSVFLLHLRLDPDQIDLTVDMLDVSATHEGDGDGPSGLVDGKEATYWHSPWGGSVTNADPVYGITIDITLKSPLTAIVFSYCTRAQNANGVPTHICVGVSNDKTNWTLIGDVATDEMASATTAQWITLPVMKSTTSFKYIRFGIAESVAGDLRINYASSPKWTALAELQLFGTAEN